MILLDSSCLVFSNSQWQNLMPVLSTLDIENKYESSLYNQPNIQNVES